MAKVAKRLDQGGRPGGFASEFNLFKLHISSGIPFGEQRFSGTMAIRIPMEQGSASMSVKSETTASGRSRKAPEICHNSRHK